MKNETGESVLFKKMEAPNIPAELLPFASSSHS